VLEGREPTAEELSHTPAPPGIGIALATESLAQHLRSFGAVVGQVVIDRNRPFRIAGVIGDLHIERADDAGGPGLLSYYPMGLEGPTLLVRVRGDVAAARSDVLQVLAPVWGARATKDVVHLAEVAAASARDYRARMIIVQMVAGPALVLCLLGVVGTMHDAIRHRAREIAIRLAIGAGRAQVRWMLIQRSVLLSTLGTSAGLIGGFWVGRMVQQYLYGTQGTDWMVMALVGGAVVLCSWATASVTALAADRIEGATLLRQP
jgi:hypothetical protein